MKALLDADILTYEIASCGQFTDEESGELVIRDFEAVAELLDQKIKEIMEECWAESCTLYLTNDPTLQKILTRYNKSLSIDTPPYEENFRVGLAKAKPYKGNRQQEKPFHRDNLRAYMLANYDCKVANGMEADDLMAIDQSDDTIICTRDKDLRMVEGWHFGWPCGNQPQWGPAEVKQIGELSYDESKKKLTGTGIKFFYSQVLTGDTVDNYPGLPRCGPAKAWALLESAGSEAELFEATTGAYRDKYGDDWEQYFYEQADLAWMCRELTEDGKARRFSYREASRKED